ncbi:LCP family protein [Streptomyces sp. NPDC001262]|uniref:LCP family protein n=1 Tax=Streptomyces TaxID=1883 RepID=UPI0036931C21
MGKRKKSRARQRKTLQYGAWGAASLVIVSGAATALLYAKLNGNIDSVDLDAQLGTDRPDSADSGGLNILVLGSDSRSGDNEAYGRDEGSARSDTAMIVHLHPGRDRASVVSIPRDTLVERPECPTPDGGTAPARERQMFNTAYTVGGPACAVKTVEAMSGIRMDHFVEVGFAGFKKLVDTLGGVPLTIEQPIRDKDSHLDIRAGAHTLDGEQALALVRTRKGIGDGSDLGRIGLQQAFVKALIARVEDVGLLTSPKKLYDLADTATGALTTDSSLASVKALAGLARSLSGLGPADLQMVTLPVTEDAIDRNRVVPVDKDARALWEALRADEPLPDTVPPAGRPPATVTNG